MKRRVYERLLEYCSDPAFYSFQNELARSVYEAMGQGYVASENEVSLVHRQVDALNGQTFRALRLHAEVIHGSKSYVEFNYMDKPVTKELGDSLVISLVSAGSTRLFQRICIIQNKKDHKGSWSVDREQLFLLKNFPCFSGNKGIFRGSGDLLFRNNSGCLGAYGLFLSPGEMILASAPLVTEYLRGQATLNQADVSTAQYFGNARSNAVVSGFPPAIFQHRFLDELLHHYGLSAATLMASNGFLGNTHFCRDIYDFAKDWTQVNLGEPTFAFDRVLNPHVDAFANFIMRRLEVPDMPTLPHDNYFAESSFEGTYAVFLMHFDVGKNE